jgi:hypothetical protein
MLRTQEAATALFGICLATLVCEVCLFSAKALDPVRGLAVQMAKFGAVWGLWIAMIIDEKAARPTLETPWFVVPAQALLFSLLR